MTKKPARHNLCVALIAFMAMSCVMTTTRAQADPQFVVSNGYLTGIDNVFIPQTIDYAENYSAAGAYYNLSFVTGKCSTVFGSCTTDAIHSDPLYGNVFGVLLDLVNNYGKPLPGKLCDDIICSLFVPDQVDVTEPVQGFFYFLLNFKNSVLVGAGPGGDHGPFNGDPAPHLDPTHTFVTITAVPEPPSWAMLLFGFAGIGLMMRARRKHRIATV